MKGARCANECSLVIQVLSIGNPPGEAGAQELKAWDIQQSGLYSKTLSKKLKLKKKKSKKKQ